jgi:hypothetical protein
VLDGRHGEKAPHGLVEGDGDVHLASPLSHLVVDHPGPQETPPQVECSNGENIRL